MVRAGLWDAAVSLGELVLPVDDAQRCGRHAALVARLDPKQTFYLRLRYPAWTIERQSEA